MPRLNALIAACLAVAFVIAAAASPIAAQMTAVTGMSEAGSHPVTGIAGTPAPLRLAFLNDNVPTRRHIDLPLSESDATLRVPSQVRLLLFSPHPDDETLGAGGLAQRVLKRGGSVRVVWMTNGDGFLDGVRSEFEIAEPTDHDFIKYGTMRQAEALKAISEWGLEEGDAIFLGFPDGGLHPLWEAHWSVSKPYTSPHTRRNRSTYPNTYTRAVQYSGATLVEQIMGVMREYSPDWVVLPDPRDHHPDHSATGAFVLEALRKLRASGERPFSETQAFTYLVHYPAYPISQGWMTSVNRPSAGGALSHGQALNGTQWVTLPIDSDELEGKRRALARHDSQAEPLGPFLKLFMMHYEMFGRLRPSQIMEAPLEFAARYRKPNS
ncbi:MAG: PIG-L family deacetylase [Syntrophobacteraceae bacterium]|nr:PIG-L family deacetylase [Syntrophobacteraceae bacterium]